MGAGRPLDRERTPVSLALARVPQVAPAFVALAVLALLGNVAWASTARQRSNPFAHVDVVRLVASTPGIHKSEFEPDRSDPLEFDSEPYGVSGEIDRKAVRSGLLSNGEWALIVPFSPDEEALVYRWVGSRAVVAGVLRALHLDAAFSVHAGELVVRQPIYAMLGHCRRIGWEFRHFDVESGKLRATAMFTDPRKLSPILETPLSVARQGRNPYRGVSVAEFAARTPGLYRLCGTEASPWFRYYYTGYGNLFGSPSAESAVSFRSNDGTWLIAIPFASGGMGGVFSGAVYRLDKAHRVVLVRILVSLEGHMNVQLVAGKLHVVAPDGPEPSDHTDWFFRDTTYEYEAGTNRLRAVASALVPSFAEYRKLRAPTPAPTEGTSSPAPLSLPSL